MFSNKGRYLYDKNLEYEICRKFTGDTKKEKVLRAFACKYIKSSDIRKLFVFGKSGIPANENYILIKKCNVDSTKSFKSGSDYSVLDNVSLHVKNGFSIKTETWRCTQNTGFFG